MASGQQHTDGFRAAYGPWALVTGASDGIGREMARSLANRGLNLILVARRRDRLAALAAELTGVRCVALVLDLAQPDAGAVLAERTEDIGLVVLAAGFGTSGSFLQTAAADETNMVDVNCRAVVDIAHRFAPRLARRGRGGFIFMSSLVGFQGVPRLANYAATKAYVQTLAEGLAAELEPSGIAVLACAPGPVASGFAHRARMNLGKTDRPASVAEGALQALGRRRLARPGRLSKLLSYSLTGLSRRARTAILGRVMLRMTANSDGPRATRRSA